MILSLLRQPENNFCDMLKAKAVPARLRPKGFDIDH